MQRESKIENVDDHHVSFPILQKIKTKHHENLFFGHVNANSIGNKLESFQEIIQNTLDIFLVCETKIDSGFPNERFSLPEYRILRKDRRTHGGRLIIYVNEDLSCIVLQKYLIHQDLEIIFLELKLSKTKLLIIGTYKPASLK